MINFSNMEKDLINWIDMISEYKYTKKIKISFNPNMIFITTEADTFPLNSRASEIEKLIQAYLFKKYNYKQKFSFLASHPDKANYLRLKKIAINSATEVKQTGIKISLSNLDAGERKIVHKILSKYPDIKTKSSGEKDNRTLEITSR